MMCHESDRFSHEVLDRQVVSWMSARLPGVACGTSMTEASPRGYVETASADERAQRKVKEMLPVRLS
jgi:hypothetical protein